MEKVRRSKVEIVEAVHSLTHFVTPPNIPVGNREGFSLLSLDPIVLFNRAVMN